MSISTGTLPRRWQDKTNLALGLLVLVSPWVLGYASSPTAAWNAWIIGAFIVIAAALELVGMPIWIEWGAAFGGFWMFLSPRIMGFAEVSTATVCQMVVGAAVVIFALWSAISAARVQTIPAKGEPPVKPPSHPPFGKAA